LQVESTFVDRKLSIGGALRSCGGPHIPKFTKTPLIYTACFIFQFEGLGALFGGASSTKLPCGDGTGWGF